MSEGHQNDDTITEEEGRLEEGLEAEREESQVRRRSVSSVTPSSHISPRISRGRSYSSAGPKGASPRRAKDASALSVEVAVANVQQRQQQWREQQQREHEQQQQQQQRRQQERQQQPTGPGKNSHRRSRSMMSRVLTPMMGNASMGSSARGSRLGSLDERVRRNSLSTAIRTDRVSSAEEKEKHMDGELLENSKEEEEEGEKHQQVVRRHEPQRSVPSILDLFNLEPGVFTQPPPSHARNKSPVRDTAATCGDVAGSLAAGRQQRQNQAPENDVERERGAEAGRSGSDAIGRWRLDPGGQQQPRQQATPPLPLPEHHSFHAGLNSPPTAYRDEGGIAVLSPLPAHSCRQGASADGGGSAATFSRPRGRDGEDRRHQQQLGDFRANDTAEPTTAVYGAGSLYEGLSLDGSSGGGGGNAIAALQQQELSLARHTREASTNTVDAGRGGRRSPFRGAEAAAGRSDGLVVDHRGGGGGGRGGGGGGEGVDALDALENGNVDIDNDHDHGHGTRRGSTGCETAPTMSQSESPTSDSCCESPSSTGGSKSRGGGAGTGAGGGSSTSSYITSLGMDGRAGLMRRPSARLQNEAKHFSAQKRGVTTSYKSEELYTHFHKISFFLVVMGIVIGLGSHGIDEGIEVFIRLGEKIVDTGGAAFGGGKGPRFFFFWLYDIVLTGIAAMLTTCFSPAVEGSGIPAMKYMMDTDDLANKLKQFTIVAVVVKACGLILAAGGGLNIGREGPYTHLGGMVSYQLISRIPFFNDILKKETVLRQVLAASVAVGLSSTFAATIGGVLFSIEITTLYYDVGNYFKAFVAAISGTVAVSLVRTLAEGSPEYIERDFFKDEFEVWQYPVFAAMGVLCGFVGPLYVNFRLNMLKLGRYWGKHSIRKVPARRLEYVRAATAVACLAATITAVLSFFPGRFTRLTPLSTFKELLKKGDLDEMWSEEFTDGIFVALPVSIVVWIITATLGTSVTVPSGDFVQTTVIGATVGRLIGEVLALHLGESYGVVPSTFALVGAAAMSCAATQTISAAVVIMEMTGSFELDKPVLFASVVACGFSRQFGLNIYDSVMQLNGLESLYGLDMRRSEEMTAKDIMETDLKVVPCQTTIGELLRVLRGDEGGRRRFESYPVVTGLEGMAFVGTVSRKDLVHIVLTGGSHPCSDSDYFDFVVDNLPKKDLTSSWDRLGEGLHSEDKQSLFQRLPEDVKQAVEGGPGAANTVRALKLIGDKIGNMAPDLSFMRGGGGSTLSKGGGGRRMSLNTLCKANWNLEILEDPFKGRPVDLTAIAQRATGDVQIDRSVWKAHENMPLKNVYLLFANLRCIRLFIISGDRLTGIISRSILFKAMSNREGLVYLGDGSSRSVSERSRMRASFTVSARNHKKRWVDVFFGERPRRGPGQGF